MIFYTIFAAMEKSYLHRRSVIALKLQSKYAKTKDKMANCRRVAEVVGTSVMTVNNYMNGRVSDGFLAEDILKAW